MHLYCSEKKIFVPFRSNTFLLNSLKKFKKEINKLGINDYFLN